MHELSVVEAIRETALRHARSAGASRILSVRVVLADYSSYLEDALAMFWDEACDATEAAGARIEFVRIPAELLCLECLESFTGGGMNLRCPDCGSDWVKLISGDECYVESIDVEAKGGLKWASKRRSPFHKTCCMRTAKSRRKTAPHWTPLGSWH